VKPTAIGRIPPVFFLSANSLPPKKIIIIIIIIIITIIPMHMHVVNKLI